MCVCVMSVFSSKVVFNVNVNESTEWKFCLSHGILCYRVICHTHTHLFNLCNQ